MSSSIRPATPDDIPELARLRWQLYTERETHDEPFESYVERFAAFARDALARDDWRAWCAEEDDRLVAAMWLHTVPRVPAPGHGAPRPMGYLTNMYVEPDHRSQGLGSRDAPGARGALHHKRFRAGAHVPGGRRLRLLRAERVHAAARPAGASLGALSAAGRGWTSVAVDGVPQRPSRHRDPVDVAAVVRARARRRVRRQAGADRRAERTHDHVRAARRHDPGARGRPGRARVRRRRRVRDLLAERAGVRGGVPRGR